MTREEEIKARLSKDTAVYLDDLTGSWDNRADDDMEYLLARNKELQRRVEKMEAVVDIGRKIVSANDDSIAVLNGEKKISNKKGFLDALAYEMSVLEFKLKKELSAFDAADAEEK